MPFSRQVSDGLQWSRSRGDRNQGTEEGCHRRSLFKDADGASTPASIHRGPREGRGTAQHTGGGQEVQHLTRSHSGAKGKFRNNQRKIETPPSPTPLPCQHLVNLHFCTFPPAVSSTWKGTFQPNQILQTSLKTWFKIHELQDSFLISSVPSNNDFPL